MASTILAILCVLAGGSAGLQDSPSCVAICRVARDCARPQFLADSLPSVSSQHSPNIQPADHRGDVEAFDTEEDVPLAAASVVGPLRDLSSRALQIGPACWSLSASLLPRRISLRC